MAQFLTPLVLTLSETHIDCGKWTVSSLFKYQSDILNKIIEVPQGFPTDLASVPRVPIIFLLTGDTSTEAAVIHDFLYTSKLVSRSLADRVFLEACKTTKVPYWRRQLMYLGIRIFGNSHYKQE